MSFVVATLMDPSQGASSASRKLRLLVHEPHSKIRIFKVERFFGLKIQP